MKKLLSLLVAVLSMTASVSFAQNGLERVPVFTMGEDGSQYYRIPALTQTENGTLVAIADDRGSALGDLPNIISIVAKTSSDGGKTWGNRVTIAQKDATAGTTYGDAAVVYDAVAKKIVTVFVGNENYGSNCVGLWASNSTYPLRLYKSESSDNGATWTKPADISESIYNGIYGSRNAWIGMFAGSGSAVQLKKGEKAGRLMFVVAARNNSTWGGTMSNYAVYSDDHGATWQVSTMSASSDGDEAKIVELENGELLMSIKNRAQGYRLMARSTDQGETWTNAAVNENLKDPACNGDVVSYEADGKYYLIHSMPASGSTRENVTVYLSLDGGKTWPVSRCVYEGYSAYSVLQVLADGTIGIIVEEGKWDSKLPGADGFNLAYYNFTLDWLLEGANVDNDAMSQLSRAKSLLAREGIGYPAAAPRATLQAVVEATEANPTTENGLALSAAIDAYLASDDLVMPQVGKAYSFISRGKANDYYMYNNNGTLALKAYTDGNELPEKAKFTCEYDETAAKYLFKTSDTSYYLAYPSPGKGWLSDKSETGLEPTAGRVTQFEISKITIDSNVDATVEELYGLVHLWGYRGWEDKGSGPVDFVGPLVVKSTGTFDGAGGDYFNSNVSSAFTILPADVEAAPEVVKYTISVSANPAEGGTATVNGQATVEVNQNSMASLVATVNSGYEFLNWTKNGNVVSTEKTFRVAVAESAEYVANFSKLVVETEYSTVTGNIVSSSRYMESFDISNGLETLHVKAVDAGGPVYVNRTQSHILYVQPGDVITFPTFNWTGEWMHAYAYIDYDNNKQFNTTPNNDGTGNGELVTYNCYGSDVTGYRDINGNTVSVQYATTVGKHKYTNDFGTSYGLPAFKLPEALPLGDYRLRVSIAWNGFYPDGYGNIKNEQGILLDMILRVASSDTYVVKISSPNSEMGAAYIDTEGTLSKAVANDGEQTVVLNAVANEGYEFINWTLDGQEVSTEAVYTTTNITENREYVANFAKMWLLRSEINGDGEGTIEFLDEEGNEITDEYVSAGTKVCVKVTAAKGYELESLEINFDEVLEEPVKEWSMNEVEAVANYGELVIDVYATFSKAEEPTGVDNAVVDAVEVRVADRAILVNGYTGAVRVVNTCGQVVANVAANGKAHINVARGIYMVIAGEQVAKVVVR